MGRSAARGGQRQVSGKGHGLPRRDGGAWQVRATVPALRDEGAADPVRVERDELLPAVPDRRQAAGGSGALAIAARRLAANAGGIRSAQIVPIGELRSPEVSTSLMWGRLLTCGRLSIGLALDH